MKKIWMITALLLPIVLSFYVGMAVKSAHPMDKLFTSVIEEINKTHVIKFKSGFAINIYDKDNKLTKQWQMKRQGTYDAWSKYLHYENVARFEDIDEADEETSLSFEEKGNLLLAPIKELYYKNNMLFTNDRITNQWSYTPSSSYDLLELLPLNSEVLNRYAKYYKADNRGKFVVFFFSIDPNYLTRTFPDIIKTEGYEFPYRFKEGTIKILVYSDTLLPRRVYSLYLIENTETQEVYEYNINTYFNNNEDYIDNEEPAIPDSLKALK